MSEAIETEIIDTGPIDDGVSAISTEGMAADLAAELAAADAAKAEAVAKTEAKTDKAAKEPSKSIDEAIEKAMAKSQAKADGKEVPADKVDPEADTVEKEEKPKAQRAPDGKFASPEKEAGNAGGLEAEASAQSEGKKVNAPARLLPSEREVWVNTPRRVQEAFGRLEAEFAAEYEKHREATEFSESLRQFRDMAKAANTTVPDALGRYVEVDKLLAQDFGRGMAQIAQSHGKNPVEAVAQFMRAAGVMPQQLGAYLQGQPAPQQSHQQRPADPQVAHLQQELSQMKQYMQQQQQAQVEAQKAAEAEAKYREIEEKIINPMRAEMPRYEELSPAIAKFLQSDIIDRSLSPELRLREAYFAADRMNPAPQSPLEDAADPDTEGKVTPLPRKKQISGSPVASTRSNVKKGPAPSIDEALERAFRSSTR